MRQVILGTAGHIDHGKTSLIKALTGIDTDRLKEEKQRGITIELGFAHLTLPSGQRIGIVDVPGHEKFVKNMVAGATGIDLVALVIAADEGVMPQTREHLEICQLLNVRHGLVVLTKIDMVESDWLEMVKEDVSEYLSETFLADAPILEVSSLSGEGIEELIRTLNQMVENIPERDSGYFFRLPVDRVFTMKGFGTVITGTTISGKVRTGEEITIYPQEVHSKVRGIQVHNSEAGEVGAGLRTAINLQGLEKAQIQRGNVLATKDSLRKTYMLDVSLDLLPDAARKLKNRAKVRFHTGSSEIMSTVILLDRDELEPGDSCYAQLRLQEPTAVIPQDRYILRSYSPVRAIGGGEILNALPQKHKRFSDTVMSELKILEHGDRKQKIEQFILAGRIKGMDRSELQFLTNTSKKAFEDHIKDLLAQKTVSQYVKEPPTYIHSKIKGKNREEIISILDRYHQKNPLKTGVQKEELRSQSFGSFNPKLFQHVVDELTKEGEVVQEQEIVRLKDHKVTLAQDQEKARIKIEEVYQKGGLQPPYFKELKDKLGIETGKEVLDLLVNEGLLIKAKEDLYFHQQPLEDLKKKLIDFLSANNEITTPQFKDMTGASRKYTIPLLEYFDKTQLTVRVGDSRILRKK